QVKCLDDQRRQGGIGAAADHGVNGSGLYLLAGIAEGVGGGGAAGGNEVAEAAQTEAHGDLAGQGAVGGRGDGVDAAAAVAAGVVEGELPFDELQRSATGPDEHTDAAPLL